MLWVAELCLAHDMGGVEGRIGGAPFGRHAALRLFHYKCKQSVLQSVPSDPVRLASRLHGFISVSY